MQHATQAALRGFTLSEMLAVLAASATLISLGVPSMAGVVNSTRVYSASSELVASLMLTRNEAMKRHVRVVMCKSADGKACTSLGSWQQGWIVFVDSNGDGERAATELLLQAKLPLGSSLRFTATSPVAKYVSYGPSGATLLVGGGFQAGTLTVCGRSMGATSARQVILSAGGRPRTQKVQLPSCNPA
jgi:type IV fimbrial biogenesis protein FimT